MKLLEYISLSNTRMRSGWKRYLWDTLLAAVLALLVTIGIHVLRLYPKIPNISVLYLLIVLVLANIRGRYAAICVAIISFIAFDFFLVTPVFLFTIEKVSDWLALFVFLITAIITGQLAAKLRERAEQATQRENETRALYEMLNATASARELDSQLHLVARAIVNNFAFSGVRDCAILLPGEAGKLALEADAYQSPDQVVLSSDEEKALVSVMREGKIIDVHIDGREDHTELHTRQWFRRSITTETAGQRYVRLIPLRIEPRVVGIARLIMEDTPDAMTFERAEKERLNPRAAFFWTFLDQAAIIIERARLRRDALRVELLQRTDALRAALLSSVSHDLRTPLASIKASASSLLQEDVQWDEEARSGFATAIEREADRLNRLVGNLLDMTRIEGGALKPEKEWYPIDELIHDVLNHMQFLLQDRDVQVELPDDLPPVELDYLQMDQVLTNLLENAVRYTSPSSPIEVSAREEGNEMVISVADRGPGIPPADLERIFDKFHRVLNTSRKGVAVKNVTGSGLGLAVCRGLVEAHGGRIWAENGEGGGAIFRFTLPLGSV